MPCTEQRNILVLQAPADVELMGAMHEAPFFSADENRNEVRLPAGNGTSATWH